MTNSEKLSRRDFLKLGGLGLGAAALQPWERLSLAADFPESERLGRVVDPVATLRSRPTVNAPEIGQLSEDSVVPWLREVAGYTPYRNQRWV